MSRRIFVALLMAVCLLVGCGNNQLYPEGKSSNCKDLAFTIPGDFVDMSTEDSAEDADFMYGRKTLIFQGLAEEKAKLQTMTLAQYTDYVISGNKLPCTAAPSGEGYLFTYEKPVADTVYAYTVATYETDGYFWVLQFFGPTADVQENQPEIDIILESIRKNT